MRRALEGSGAAVLILLATGCESEAPEGGDLPLPPSFVRVESAPPICEEIGLATPLPLQVDTLAAGLEAPWDLAFLPDGRILLTERPGRVRVLSPDQGLREEPWAVLDVNAVAEAGLLGIDPAPDFAESGEVYLLGTFPDSGENPVSRVLAAVRRRLAGRTDPDAASAWKNRVVRLVDRDGSGVDPVTVVEDLPSGPVHAGGAIRFGPDGLLYLTLGDGANTHQASNWTSLRGKILRYDPNGEPAADNPRPGSPVFAAGFRNPQGLVWDPRTGTLFAPDHGPTGMPRERSRSDHDELNQVVAGGDYGWDMVAGMWRGEGVVTPITEWVPAIAPAGIALVSDSTALWDGNVFVTGLVSQQLVRVVLAPDPEDSGRMRTACRESLLRDEYGRLRAIRSGPDGALYLTTSNRDQRGRARETDDLLLRIVPPRKEGPAAPGI